MPTLADMHAFLFARDDEPITWLGDYTPAGHQAGRPDATVSLHLTRSKSDAKRWLRDLRAGKLPDTSGPTTYLHEHLNPKPPLGRQLTQA
jgi:hypothetical protein